MKVGHHPDADSLYVEEIDLGEGQPRQVRGQPGCHSTCMQSASHVTRSPVALCARKQTAMRPAKRVCSRARMHVFAETQRPIHGDKWKLKSVLRCRLCQAW